MLLFLLSPAKKLDETRASVFKGESNPPFLKESESLITILKEKSPQELESLMRISEKLAVLNAGRYSDFSLPFTHENAKEAIYLFNGDAYNALDAYSLNQNKINYLEKSLIMLSGLYGAVAPLDLIAPYRLEMGTALVTPQGKNLYEFWGNKITQYLNKIIVQRKITAVVNLASHEYYSTVQPKDLNVPVITPTFKDLKNGQYKVISFNAKKARGLMVRYGAEKNINNLEDLQRFSLNGYVFKGEDANQPNEWLFYKD